MGAIFFLSYSDCYCEIIKVAWRLSSITSLTMLKLYWRTEIIVYLFKMRVQFLQQSFVHCLVSLNEPSLWLDVLTTRGKQVNMIDLLSILIILTSRQARGMRAVHRTPTALSGDWLCKLLEEGEDERWGWVKWRRQGKERDKDSGRTMTVLYLRRWLLK